MVQRIAAALVLLALAANAQYASYNPATSAANTVSGSFLTAQAMRSLTSCLPRKIIGSSEGTGGRGRVHSIMICSLMPDHHVQYYASTYAKNCLMTGSGAFFMSRNVDI